MPSHSLYSLRFRPYVTTQATNMGVGDISIRSSERPETGSVNIPVGVFPASSKSDSVDAHRVANEIVTRFNDALAKRDHAAIADLFCKDNSYWRDHLAMTWDLRTAKGSCKCPCAHCIRDIN